jgi:hypothetical protein
MAEIEAPAFPSIGTKAGDELASSILACLRLWTVNK